MLQPFLFLLLIKLLPKHLTAQPPSSCQFDSEKFNESLQHAPIVISATVLQITIDPRNNHLQVFLDLKIELVLLLLAV
ncbi:unnamed protein product [Gongylonema pulchrum]|uniref:Secreted protein n=1 Tax=Gongylonema pulchrum TaxID=637853 RepID=A0A183DA16_9BILA|nr:unnamed protein product [Gongylonema pulchrum]